MRTAYVALWNVRCRRVLLHYDGGIFVIATMDIWLAIFFWFSGSRMLLLASINDTRGREVLRCGNTSFGWDIQVGECFDTIPSFHIFGPGVTRRLLAEARRRDGKARRVMMALFEGGVGYPGTSELAYRSSWAGNRLGVPLDRARTYFDTLPNI